MEVFERYWRRYDDWYDRNREIFRREVEALRGVLGNFERGLEVGVGTGRFAVELGIEYGIDVSLSMLKVAKERGVEVIRGDAKYLPFKRVFDAVFFIFTLCFLDDPLRALKSARDVLVDGGRIVVCTIPKESKLAREYMEKDSPFYRVAKFYTVDETVEIVKSSGFDIASIGQYDVKYGKDLLVLVGEI